MNLFHTCKVTFVSTQLGKCLRCFLLFSHVFWLSPSVFMNLRLFSCSVDCLQVHVITATDYLFWRETAQSLLWSDTFLHHQTFVCMHTSLNEVWHSKCAEQEISIRLITWYFVLFSFFAAKLVPTDQQRTLQSLIGSWESLCWFSRNVQRSRD